MKNNKHPFAATVIAALWVAIATPCQAQQERAEIPILAQYVGGNGMFFARAGDSGVLFSIGDINKGHKEGERSNVWVAVTQPGAQTKFSAKTEIWTDTSGRPHSLSVLKLQIEFNDALKYAADPFRSSEKVDSLVVESGVLDRETLSIPHRKLIIRAKRIAEKLRYQDLIAEGIALSDPAAAALKSDSASYVSSQLAEASSRLRELRQAIDSVPVTGTRDVPDRRDHKDETDGLGGLNFAWSGLRYIGPDGHGNSRYYSGEGRAAPEMSVKEFIDPIGMAPAIIADLRDKESAAAKAVSLVESLDKELLTP